ncbi:MAG: hypothetical protein ABEJ26_13815 [Halosimplex sp.]
MTTDTQAETSGESTGTVDRRTVLKMAGGTAVAVTALSGTASAHQSKFFGCERVCSGTDGDYAVVSVDDGYECRLLENRGRDEDVPWDWDAHCYVAGEGEAVVGYLAEDQIQGDERTNKGCWLCVNPNACAEEHYEDARQIRSELDGSTCGPCEGEMNISVECESTAGPADGEWTDDDSDDDGSDGSGDDERDDEATDSGNETAEPTDGASTPVDTGTAADRTESRTELADAIDRLEDVLARIVPDFRR